MLVIIRHFVASVVWCSVDGRGNEVEWNGIESSGIWMKNCLCVNVVKFFTFCKLIEINHAVLKLFVTQLRAAFIGM